MYMYMYYIYCMYIICIVCTLHVLHVLYVHVHVLHVCVHVACVCCSYNFMFVILFVMPFPVLSFKRFRNAVIEITSMDAGVFEVKGRVLGVALDKFELVFQVRERERDAHRIIAIKLCCQIVKFKKKIFLGFASDAV